MADSILLPAEAPSAQNYATYGLAASAQVARGQVLGFSGVNVRPFQSGDRVAGVAMEDRDNTGGAAAAKSIDTLLSGRVEANVVGVTTSTVPGTRVFVKNADGSLWLTDVGGTFFGFVKKAIRADRAVIQFSVLPLAQEAGSDSQTFSGAGPHAADLATDLVLVATGAGNVVLNIPAAASRPGRPLTVKKTTADAETVTITPAAGTVDGAANLAIGAGGRESWTLVSDGTNYHILAGYIPA